MNTLAHTLPACCVSLLTTLPCDPLWQDVRLAAASALLRVVAATGSLGESAIKCSLASIFRPQQVLDEMGPAMVLRLENKFATALFQGTFWHARVAVRNCVGLSRSC